MRVAEPARTELDALAQVLLANLTQAALEAAPVLAGLSSWLAEIAGKAGIAWNRLFDAPEEKSLRTLRHELDLTTSKIEKLEGRIRELRESPTLGFTSFIDTAQISALERKLEELRRARDQTQARIAFLAGPPETGTSAPKSASASDDTAGVEERAKSLERIARELEGMLFNITHEGSARTRTATEQYADEVQKLNELLGAGAIDQTTYTRAIEDANDRLLRASQEWTDGAVRFLKDYVAESQATGALALWLHGPAAQAVWDLAIGRLHAGTRTASASCSRT